MEQVANYIFWLKSRGLNYARQRTVSFGIAASQKILVVTDEASTYETLLTAILRAINLGLVNVQITSDPSSINFDDVSHILDFGLNVSNVPESVKLVSTAKLSQLDISKELKKSLWQSLIVIKNDFVL